MAPVIPPKRDFGGVHDLGVPMTLNQTKCSMCKKRSRLFAPVLFKSYVCVILAH